MNEKLIQKELFDKIYEPKKSLKELKKLDKMFGKEVFGTLEVIGRDITKNNKIVHHEKPSPNKVLVWAKHCMAKMMAGDIMALYGSNRNSPDSGSILYGKGTTVSNRQIFTNNSGTYLDDYNYVANNFTSYANMVFPYFPTKMLFGTANGVDGAISCSTNDTNVSQETTITDQSETLNIVSEGWVQSIHPSGSITGIDSYDYSVGKNWSNFTNTEYSTNFNNWLPAFVYMKRSRPFQAGTETAIDKYVSSYDEYNKVTYTVVLPSQLSSRWYPYNDESSGSGVMLKYAGLFCDAAWIDYSGTSEVQVLTSDLGKKFQNGICWAKRAITPVIKSDTISLEFVWNIYMPRES